MKIKTALRLLRNGLALTATLGASFSAAANSGPYIGIEGGINQQADQNVDRNGQDYYTYEFKKGYIGGLVFGYAAPSGLRPEFEIDFRKNKFDAVRAPAISTSDVSGNENLYTGLLNLWFDFSSPSGFFSTVHPYLGGGGGVARVEAHDPTIVVAGVGPFGTTATARERTTFDSVFTYQGGAGVGFDLSPTLTLSLDYRHMETHRASFDSSVGPLTARYRSNSAMVGLRHSFGDLPPPPPAPEPVVVLPVDTDGDGVVDGSDNCPGTPRGFRVDAVGCIVEQKLVLRSVNFVFDSDQLTEPAKETLDEVAAALAAQPALSVEIVGHTDSVGAPEYNQKLSQQRTDSVRAYLVSKGVKPENLQARGAGESAPIASNDTEEGRAENRRVEFIVVSKPANVKVTAEGPTEQSKSAAEAGEPANLPK